MLSEILAGQGNVRALRQRLSVSEATIRRDLIYLSQAGLTTRTYGGAVGGPRKFELSLHEKESLFQSRKLAIARRALEHINDGDTAILDAGTTIGRLATLISGCTDVTVITNGISSILALASDENVELISLGGSLRHITQAFVGPLAEAVLERLSADVAFLGANGVGKLGICCPTANHAALKSRMTERATKVFILADSSKLAKAPHQHWVPLHREWTLITDSNASQTTLDELRASGLDLEVVDVADDAITHAGTPNGAAARAPREEQN